MQKMARCVVLFFLYSFDCFRKDEAAAGDCYECLLAIAISSENGVHLLLGYGAFSVVAHQLQNSAPGRVPELCIILLQDNFDAQSIIDLWCPP
jgi:hypothetical protein